MLSAFRLLPRFATLLASKGRQQLMARQKILLLVHVFKYCLYISSLGLYIVPDTTVHPFSQLISSFSSYFTSGLVAVQLLA